MGLALMSELRRLLRLLHLLRQEPRLLRLLRLRPVVEVAAHRLDLCRRGRGAGDAAGHLLGLVLAMVLGVRPS